MRSPDETIEPAKRASPDAEAGISGRALDRRKEATHDAHYCATSGTNGCTLDARQSRNSCRDGRLMGFNLRREIRDVLPPGLLTARERLLVLELADNCSDDSRRGWPGVDWLAEKADVAAGKVGEMFAQIGKKWVELRVPLGVGKDGRAFYSKTGTRTVFEFPPLVKLEALKAPQSGVPSKAPQNRVPEAPQNGVPRPPDLGGPNPSGSSSKDSSSLSPHAGGAATDAVVPRPRTEREMKDDSQKQDLTPVQRLLVKHGAVGEDQIGFVEATIDMNHNVLSPGFYFAADKNGSLAQLVGDALAEYQADGSNLTGKKCIRCDGWRGEWNGDYFANQCLACHGGGTAVAGDERKCPKHPHQPIGCGSCRADRLASAAYQEQLNHQQRSSARPSMSPADQRVAESEQLYRKYLDLERGEANPGTIWTGKAHLLVDSRHPDRDYPERL